MKKLTYLFILLGLSNQSYAISDVNQSIILTTTSGLINAGTAIYMQGQGMNPQFVVTPYGTTVVPNSSNPTPSENSDPNLQAQKKAFFYSDS